jgi:hypothetical protein
MAISPLALGIGLQGKYDYKTQAALEMSRQRGRAKAEADAETARAKKLAPIERRLINMRGAPLLPVHQKEVTRKVTEALDYMMEHPEDLSGVTQRAYDIEASTQAYKEQYNSYKRSQIGKNVKGNAEAIRVLGVIDNPDDINDAFGGIAGSTIRFDPQSKNVTFEPIDYLPTAKHIENAFTAGGTQYYDATGKEPTVKVGKKVYTNFGLNAAVPEMIKQDVLNARDKVIALTNDYSQYLESNNKPLPNLRTAEGKQEFNDGMVAFLDESIAQEFANRGLLRDITPGQGRSITINMGNDMTQPATLGGSGSINLQYDADPNTIYHATGLAGNALGNHDGLFAYTNRTFDMKTGNPIEKVGSENSTFNQIDAFYTLNKDIKFKGIPFKKGMIIPDEYLDQAIDKGYATVEILALGKEKKGRGAKSFYVPMNQIEQVRYMNANKNDRPLILEAQRKQNEAFAALNQKQPAPSGNTGGSSKPATKTKPKPAPPAPTGKEKPKNDGGKIDPNKAASIEKANKEAGGELKRFKKN